MSRLVDIRKEYKIMTTLVNLVNLVNEEYIEVMRPSILSKSIIENLNIVVCNLKKTKCHLPNESNFDDNFKDVKEIKKRNEGFYILANKLNISNHLKKTKFCNIFLQEGKCNRKVCNFAHSIEEFSFPSCAFADHCKVKNCKFKHTSETLEQYKSRINFKVPYDIKKIKE
jgi:hypothetical protein